MKSNSEGLKKGREQKDMIGLAWCSRELPLNPPHDLEPPIVEGARPSGVLGEQKLVNVSHSLAKP
jgi:hypothetical protein